MEITNNLLDIADVKKSKISLLDLFIRKTAVLTSTSEDLVELIIKDQWSNANKQTKGNSDIAEIDFPNIGIFFLSKRKSLNRLNTLEKSNITLNKVIEEHSLDSKEGHRAKLISDRNDDLIRSIKLKIKNQE